MTFPFSVWVLYLYDWSILSFPNPAGSQQLPKNHTLWSRYYTPTSSFSGFPFSFLLLSFALYQIFGLPLFWFPLSIIVNYPHNNDLLLHLCLPLPSPSNQWPLHRIPTYKIVSPCVCRLQMFKCMPGNILSFYPIRPPSPREYVHSSSEPAVHCLRKYGCSQQNASVHLCTALLVGLLLVFSLRSLPCGNFLWWQLLCEKQRKKEVPVKKKILLPSPNCQKASSSISSCALQRPDTAFPFALTSSYSLATPPTPLFSCWRWCNLQASASLVFCLAASLFRHRHALSYILITHFFASEELDSLWHIFPRETGWSPIKERLRGLERHSFFFLLNHRVAAVCEAALMVVGKACSVQTDVSFQRRLFLHSRISGQDFFLFLFPKTAKAKKGNYLPTNIIKLQDGWWPLYTSRGRRKQFYCMDFKS